MTSSGIRSTRPRLAFEDTEFLQREEMRGHRLALEFERAELGLKDNNIKSTVVVFGSSRARPPRGPARTATSKRVKGQTVNSGATSGDLSFWYQAAREFGRIVSERGGALTPVNGMRENVIATGGGPGIMEAANRGAHDVSAPTIGFNIQLPNEQSPNRYVTPELCFHFNYFGMRKMHFAMRANALAVFPGGFGTLDELFEILTLKQTRKSRGMPVILFGRAYWRQLINFDALVDLGTISKEDLALFAYVDEAEEGWDFLEMHGLGLTTPLRED